MNKIIKANIPRNKNIATNKGIEINNTKANNNLVFQFTSDFDFITKLIYS